MAYELENIEKKLSTEQLKKKLMLFNDNQANEYKNLCFIPGSKYKMEQSFKAATYKIITKEFQDYFAVELFRIRTSLANHRIEDPVDRFSRYINTNYKGLLKLQESEKYNKPLKVNFNSPRFRQMYESVTLHQIRYDLQHLFVAPLKKTFEEEYQSEIQPHPYLYSISKRPKSSEIPTNSANAKFRWNGPVNKLVTMFYELSNTEIYKGKPNITASTSEITEFITTHFLDNDGKEFSQETIQTILRPGRPEKRAPEHKKYKFPS